MGSLYRDIYSNKKHSIYWQWFSIESNNYFLGGVFCMSSWDFITDCIVCRDDVPLKVLKLYKPPTKLPYSVLVSGKLCDWSREQLIEQTHDIILNNRSDVRENPLCLTCRKTNSDGVMIYLPVLLNKDTYGRPIITYVTDEIRRKIEAVMGGRFNGEFIASPDEHISLRVISYGYFCDSKCVADFSEKHPEYLIPFWHPSDALQFPDAEKCNF